MIKGIGIDAVEIKRIEKSLNIKGFKTSVFTQNEINNEHGNIYEYYAARFACKEAVFKALNKNIDLRQIETLNHEDGSPYVVMKKEYECTKIHISITTEMGLAIAYAIVE